ncbi:MAG: phosphotransferase family protein [Tepidiformaceae bacterium]
MLKKLAPMAGGGALPDAMAFEAWLRAQLGFAEARVLGLAAVEGGASNITCRVALEGAPLPAVALRVQRERGIFEPYDVLREGEVLRRLARSDVPVPAVVGVEAAPGVLGGPFIVLEWVDAPHMGIAGAEADLGAYTAMVARIHALDWRALGLDFLGVPPSAAAAVRAELEAVAARMSGFACGEDALLGRALARLRETVPDDGRLALCQGDINVFNYLFRDRKVVAVVDWEQARIGDPRSDVGQLVALAHLKGAPFGPADEQPFVLAYGAAAGTPLAGMAYLRALWLFELGVIYHGWKCFNDSDPWYDWPLLAELLEASLAELG